MTEALKDVDNARAAPAEPPYPVRFSIAYSASSNRLTVLLRPLLVIPVLLIMQLITGDLWNTLDPSADVVKAMLPFAGMLWLAPLLMIVFRRKYPLWCFDSYLELYRFSARVLVYLLLLRDEYPSLDEEQAVRLRIEYPDAAGELRRFLPLVKWLLALPHLAALSVLGIAALIATVFAWFAIMVLGRYPRALFTFVEGTLRWGLRVYCYAFMLTTDRYPPFRFSP